MASLSEGGEKADAGASQAHELDGKRDPATKEESASDEQIAGEAAASKKGIFLSAGEEKSRKDVSAHSRCRHAKFVGNPSALKGEVLFSIAGKNRPGKGINFQEEGVVSPRRGREKARPAFQEKKNLFKKRPVGRSMSISRIVPSGGAVGGGIPLPAEDRQERGDIRRFPAIYSKQILLAEKASKGEKSV